MQETYKFGLSAAIVVDALNRGMAMGESCALADQRRVPHNWSGHDRGGRSRIRQGPHAKNVRTSAMSRLFLTRPTDAIKPDFWVSADAGRPCVGMPNSNFIFEGLMPLRSNLFAREVIPFCLQLAVFVIGALAIEALLHGLNGVWLGRYLGIPGVLLIIGSSGYSLRKRRIITFGNPVRLLRLHEYLGWAGSLLILVHTGVHFNAALGWLAVLAMLVNIASGLSGKFLLHRARS